MAPGRSARHAGGRGAGALRHQQALPLPRQALGRGGRAAYAAPLRPWGYDRGEEDFKRHCQKEELDAVICSTFWKWHAPICLAAMRTDKHAVSEVPIVLTVDEAWELVETYERTGKWATIALEQTLLESGGGMHLAILNMIRGGLFGEIIHGKGGYIHDLRYVTRARGGAVAPVALHSPKRKPLAGSLHGDQSDGRPLEGAQRAGSCLSGAVVGGPVGELSPVF